MRASQLHARASYTRLPPRATLSRWWSKVSNRMAGSSEPWRNPQHFSRARWWDATTVAVVTGANKGIGKECVRQLAAQGVTVVATARSTQNGEAAAAEVADGSRVLFHQLDLTDEASVEELAAWLERTFPGGIDILVNNAGMAYKGSVFGAEEARTTIGTNVFGTMRVTHALLPALKRKKGRVINVCSQAGKQRIIRSDALRRRFQEAQTEDEVRALMNEFTAAVEAGTHSQAGWPNSMYGVSKLGEATFSRVLAKREPNVTVSACCPGWCATDMSSHSGPRSPAQGADVAVWLALAQREDVPSGRFWSDRREEGF